MRVSIFWTCSSCLPAQRTKVATLTTPVAAFRTFRSAPPVASGQAAATKHEEDDAHEADDACEIGEEGGAMSRRLAQMTEEAMGDGESSAAKDIQVAGFSEELKKQLEARIAESAFRGQNQRAFAESEMPSSAGKGTRDQATAQPWTGSESLHDSTLRMLDDSHKRLRDIRPPRIPQPSNLRPPQKKSTSTGERLASARDRTSIYAAALSSDMSEEERSQMRKELKERFTPGARPMPTTLQGLTSLANERIEDAIARGQFKNIQRGRGKNVERDHNASSPFLDTTEYFMNKIIQKQEIVPPWIEKQQELVKSVASFRGRLRNDWRRHAARMIASKGGSLESQIRRAQAYALAEERVNPVQTKVESLNKIESQGNLSTVTVQETSSPASTAAAAPAPSSPQAQASSNTPTATSTIKITESTAEDAPYIPFPGSSTTIRTVSSSSSSSSSSSHPAPEEAPSPFLHILPTSHPFRDPTWESHEHAYHTLAIKTLNSQTRSYNLMAPALAQKPYHSLPRELNRCYADVAPLLANEIRQRAITIARGSNGDGDGEGGGRPGLMQSFAAAGVGQWKGHEGRVRDEDLDTKGYGFRQFWRDLFVRGVGRG